MTRAFVRRLGLAAVIGVCLGTGAVVAAESPPLTPPKPGYTPDPPGHQSTKQWMFDVVVKRGVPEVERAHPVDFSKPAESPRVLGRFAFEIWVGQELLDRVRFDVPLMGGEQPIKSPKHPYPRPNFEEVTTRVEVRMADHPRAVYMLLVDRMTQKTTRYEWPPDALGHLVPWKPVDFSAPDAWPPPGMKDAGTQDAPSGR